MEGLIRSGLSNRIRKQIHVGDAGLLSEMGSGCGIQHAVSPSFLQKRFHTVTWTLGLQSLWVLVRIK